MDHSDVSDSAKKRMSKFGLACLKCRSRKIKCDSRKPVCENCEKKGFECVFDETPKTRGPDKNPGRKRRTAAQMHAEAKLLRGQGLSETSKKSSAKAASSLSSIEKNQAFSNQFNHSAEFSSQQQIPTFLSPKIDESSSDGRRSTSSNDMLSASSSSGLLIDSSHVLASNPSHPSNHVADLRRPGPPFASGFPSQSADADEGSSDPSSLPIKFHHQHQQTRHHHRHQQQNHYIHPSAIASSYTYGAPPLSLPPPQMFSHPSGTYYSSQDPSMNARLSYPDQSNNETSQLAESHSPMRQPSQATSVHLALVSPVPSNSNQNMTSSQNNSYQLGYDNPRTQYQRYQQQNDLQQMQASSINPSHSGHVYQYPSSAPASGESQLSSGYQHYNQQRALYQQSRQSMYQAPTVSSSFPPYYQPRLPLTSTPTPVYDQAQHMEYYPPLHQQQQPDFSHQAYQSSPRLLGKRRSEEAFDQVPEQSAASQVEPVRTNDILKQPDRPPMSSRRTREDGQYMLELELSGKEKIEGPSGNNLDSWALQRATADRLVLNDLLSPGDPWMPSLELSGISGNAIGAPFSIQYTNLPFDFKGSSLSPTMIKSPSIEYSKKIWWDCLLSRYGQSRPEAYAAIIKEILTLFRISTHWIAFFNVPRFLAILHNPEQRQCLQPSLVYAMLALATQLTSWDGPGGRELDGRLLGLKLNDHAHNSFWQSWNSGFINVDLAKAAFLMSLYEVSSHPLYTRTRASQSLVLLDAVIRVLNLTAMDADNPRASRFQPDEIPRIPADARRVSPADYDELCLHAEQSIVNCSFWAACPRWSKPGSTYVDHVEIEKEEARRLCWSSSALAASASTYGHNVWKTYNNLSIANTANYALLFPGELLTEEADRIGKSSIWALYHTSSLIWHFSIRLHNDSSVSPKEKQKIFAKIWEATEETESYFGAVISDNLVYEGQTWHAKVGSLAYVWQSIDWLATSRFLIYDALVETMNASEHIPNYPVDAARRWLRVQASVAKMVCPGRAFSTDLTQRSVTMVEHRPFWIWWLIQQLARMISMYERDPSLVDILDIARGSFTPILDYLVNLYPSKVLAQTLSSRIFSRLNSLNERASHSYAVAFPASTAFGPRFPQLSSPLSDVSSCGGIEQSTTALPLLDEDVKP